MGALERRPASRGALGRGRAETSRGAGPAVEEARACTRRAEARDPRGALRRRPGPGPADLGGARARSGADLARAPAARVPCRETEQRSSRAERRGQGPSARGGCSRAPAAKAQRRPGGAEEQGSAPASGRGGAGPGTRRRERRRGAQRRLCARRRGWGSGRGEDEEERWSCSSPAGGGCSPAGRRWHAGDGEGPRLALALLPC